RRIPCQCNVGQAHGLRPAHSPGSGLPARSDQYLSYASAGQGDRLRRVSDAGDPENFWIAAEPGPLALGILARFELSGSDSLFQRDLPAQMPKRLFISQRLEGFLSPGCTVSQKRPDLFEQSAIEHRFDARIQPLMEDRAVRVQAD